MRASRLDELVSLFVELVEIASPSGEERAVADFVLAYVRELGLVADEDATALDEGGAGNIVVRVPGGDDRPAEVALCAHLDTVPTSRAPRALVGAGVVRSDGETILGADDKAAVAVLLVLLADLVADPPSVAVEFLFTVREEVGLQGAKAFDLSRLEASKIFVLDSSGLPGSVITAAPTHKLLTATFRGVAAHAGMAPEQGRSAIVAAAEAIVALPQGRIDEQTTVNVGTIRGGSATNIVAERCVVECEVRSCDDELCAATLAAMMTTCMTAATDAGIDVDLVVDDHYRGYRHQENAAILRHAEKAIAAAEIAFAPFAGNGGSDANVFNAGGRAALTLGVGYERVHSADEHMRIDRLGEMLAIADALARVS